MVDASPHMGDFIFFLETICPIESLIWGENVTRKLVFCFYSAGMGVSEKKISKHTQGFYQHGALWLPITGLYKKCWSSLEPAAHLSRNDHETLMKHEMQQVCRRFFAASDVVRKKGFLCFVLRAISWRRVVFVWIVKGISWNTVETEENCPKCKNCV